MEKVLTIDGRQVKFKSTGAFFVGTGIKKPKGTGRIHLTRYTNFRVH